MISDTTTSARYIVTSGVLSYSIPFRIYSGTDVAVFWSADARADTELTLGTDYTVTILTEGGMVNLLPDVVPVGSILAVVSNIPATQEADFSSTSTVSTAALEMQMDRTVQMVQQLNYHTSRAVILPATSDETPQEVVQGVYAARDDAANSATAASLSASAAANSAIDARNNAAQANSDADLARRWASEAEDVPVQDGEYSARHYSEKAKGAVPDNLVARVTDVEAAVVGAQSTADAAKAVTDTVTATPTPHAVLRADENNHLNLGWFGSMLCNVRAVLTTSGTWESPIDGWLKYTIIGGGGPGTSWLTGGGNQLAWGTPGGNTTISGVTAQGGATSRALPNSATVAGRYRVGGGCAGEVKVGYMRVTKGQSIAHTIGASGVAGAGTSTTGYTGSPGTDTINDSNGSSAQSWGGNGGTTGLGYGGGGGACGLTWGAESAATTPHAPGYGHDGGAHAIDASAVPLYGGNGGPGAIILEYYNPEVVS